MKDGEGHLQRAVAVLRGRHVHGVNEHKHVRCRLAQVLRDAVPQLRRLRRAPCLSMKFASASLLWPTLSKTP